MGEKKIGIMTVGFIAVFLAVAVFMCGVATADDRFMDNGNATVLDTQTGLTWTIDGNRAGKKTWDEAVMYCESLGDGWRLPTLGEMEVLMDMVAAEPPMLPVGHPFVNVQAARYWTASTIYNTKTKGKIKLKKDTSAKVSIINKYVLTKGIEAGSITTPDGKILYYEEHAWYVDLADPALSNYQDKDATYYVWLVREDL